MYEQFSRWLENPLLETDKGTKRELDARELAVVRFAGIKYNFEFYYSVAKMPFTVKIIHLFMTPMIYLLVQKITYF